MISRYSGANVFLETGDVLTANENLVCLHTSSAGSKVIQFGKAVDVFDYFTNTWHENTTSVDLGTVPMGQTRYLFYGKKADIV